MIVLTVVCDRSLCSCMLDLKLDQMCLWPGNLNVLTDKVHIYSVKNLSNLYNYNYNTFFFI